MKVESVVFLLCLMCLPWSAWAAEAARANIVWILVDDMSANFSCYGETTIRTPHVDTLAAQGTRFSRAFVTAPICSISRSALITGCYQTSIGCQNHRAGSEKFPIQDEKAIVQAMRRLHAEGKLNTAQSLIMAETRPREEFYDLAADPHELRNLAADPPHAAALAQHRAALDNWITGTDDKGRTPESEEVYLSYAYDERPEGGRGNRNDVFNRNVELMRRWAKEKPMEE